jgi:hypothetical protein
MVIYLGRPALDQIEAAQATVDRHVAQAPLGRCAVCRAEPPCRPLADALATFARFGRLPRRRPGATLADAVGVTDRFDWLEATARRTERR